MLLLLLLHPLLLNGLGINSRAWRLRELAVSGQPSSSLLLLLLLQ